MILYLAVSLMIAFSHGWNAVLQPYMYVCIKPNLLHCDLAIWKAVLYPDHCCSDGSSSDVGKALLGPEGRGKGRSKGHYADDEALQPQQYNRLYCLTPAAQITFSSLWVHFPHPGWSMLVTTPSPTNQPTQLPTLRLGSKDTSSVANGVWIVFVGGGKRVFELLVSTWKLKSLFLNHVCASQLVSAAFSTWVLLCFFISFTSRLHSVQTAHNSHDLIAMYPCIPASDEPLLLPRHTDTGQQATLSSHTLSWHHLSPLASEPHQLSVRALGGLEKAGVVRRMYRSK